MGDSIYPKVEKIIDQVPATIAEPTKITSFGNIDETYKGKVNVISSENYDSFKGLAGTKIENSLNTKRVFEQDVAASKTTNKREIDLTKTSEDK